MFKKSETMTFVLHETEEKTVPFRVGESVLAVAGKHKIPLDSSCLEGTCGSCRLTVLNAPPELEPPGFVEAETRSERGFHENERLGCQMTACPGLKVKVPVY